MSSREKCEKAGVAGLDKAALEVEGAELMDEAEEDASALVEVDKLGRVNPAVRADLDARDRARDPGT